MLKITRLNEKSFFNNLKTLNSKIEKIDEMKKDNNFLFLLNKKEISSILKREILKGREIIRTNEKNFFNNFEILNSKIEKIDETKRNNNFLFLLNKKKDFLISKRKVSNDREIISLFLKSFKNKINNNNEDV